MTCGVCGRRFPCRCPDTQLREAAAGAFLYRQMLGEDFVVTNVTGTMRILTVADFRMLEHARARRVQTMALTYLTQQLGRVHA